MGMRLKYTMRLVYPHIDIHSATSMRFNALLSQIKISCRNSQEIEPRRSLIENSQGPKSNDLGLLLLVLVFFNDITVSPQTRIIDIEPCYSLVL